MSKENLKDGANWTPEMSARFDTLTGPGGVPDDQARSIILGEAGLKVFPKKLPTRLPFSAVEVAESDIVEATQRVVHNEPDIPQPAPPQPGETDEQIRNRHRAALRSRDSELPASDGDSVPRALPPEVQVFKDKHGIGKPVSPDSTGQAA